VEDRVAAVAVSIAPVVGYGSTRADAATSPPGANRLSVNHGPLGLRGEARERQLRPGQPLNAGENGALVDRRHTPVVEHDTPVDDHGPHLAPVAL
jgi:hypothetical protein